MITLEQVAGWSALLAAVATVIGAVTLMVFFAKGGLWGLANDVASIVLMLATIPVALMIARIEADRAPMLAMPIAAIGIAGMLGATLSQALLIARVRSYKALLPWTLGAGAVVGVWYLLVGVVAWPGGLFLPPPILAIASGVSFIALGYGFLVGNERHPLSIGGGVVLLVASTLFLALFGLNLLTTTLVEAAAWNA
jgi:hypothetical protein